MTDPRILLDKDHEQHIARLTLNNPERKNCYDPQMRRAMREAMDDVANDDDIKVLLLRGAGSVFCTGADMRNAYSTGTDAGYIENAYYNEGWRVFVNLQRGRPGWLLLGKRAYEEGGFVTRIWRLNTKEAWSDGLSAQINVLSTDRLLGQEWAQVGAEPYREIAKKW